MGASTNRSSAEEGYVGGQGVNSMQYESSYLSLRDNH